MSRRSFLVLAILGAAVTAGTASAGRPAASPVEWTCSEDAAPSPESTEDASAARDGRPQYVVELSFKREGEVFFAPKVTFSAGVPPTVQDSIQRPFVVGTDRDGKPIVRVLEEGVRVDLDVTEGRDGIVTLDATVAVSEINDVGRKGAAQTVRSSTRTVRIVEPVLLGESIRLHRADGYEVTAVVESMDE